MTLRFSKTLSPISIHCKIDKKDMDKLGIEPRASRMQSERATTALHAQVIVEN